MNPEELTNRLKRAARLAGFDLVGAVPAVEPPGFGRLERWLADGHAGQMGYIARRAAAYRDPNLVLEGARSVLMLGLNYRTVEPAAAGAGGGIVARYAWGADYHDVVRSRLRRLVALHRRLVPDGRARGFVDTAPVLERDFAHRAGLGWFGKNTTLINPRLGSWFFLAGLISTEEFVCDEPADESRCGTCRRCLDACPTGALVEPYRLDARKCISYLTIERRSDFSEAERAALGCRVFGCDACQEACPWNRRTEPTAEAAFEPAPGMNPLRLDRLLTLDEEAFRARFRRSPLWRAGRAGIQRNAAAVLGNQGDFAG
jgi:epoxyqueuosine reductase